MWVQAESPQGINDDYFQGDVICTELQSKYDHHDTHQNINKLYIENTKQQWSCSCKLFYF